MMIARLKVSEALAESQNFRLPPGFDRGEERYNAIERTIEMEVSGPFVGLPEWVEESWPNGSYSRLRPEVTAVVSQFTDHLEWQWIYDGEAIGCPVHMALSPS